MSKKFRSSKERKNWISKCIASGMTYSEIARILNISRQRVWQIQHGMRGVRLDKVESNKEKHIKSTPILELRRQYPCIKRKVEKVDFYYSSSVDKERELVRIRDNHTCRNCGKKWEHGRRKFDVHHLDPKMYGKSNEKMIHKYDAVNKDKLLTLCHKCHVNLHKMAKNAVIPTPSVVKPLHTNN